MLPRPARRTDSSLILPPTIAQPDEDAERAFIEFFTVHIRNHNSRIAYARAAARFLAWVTECGTEFQQVEPVHVAAYIEDLGRGQAEGGTGYALASVKQHRAAHRMLGAFLVVHRILPSNPHAGARRYWRVIVMRKGPAFERPGAEALLESLDSSTPAGLRDRAPLGVMA